MPWDMYTPGHRQLTPQYAAQQLVAVCGQVIGIPLDGTGWEQEYLPLVEAEAEQCHVGQERQQGQAWAERDQWQPPKQQGEPEGSEEQCVELVEQEATGPGHEVESDRGQRQYQQPGPGPAAERCEIGERKRQEGYLEAR